MIIAQTQSIVGCGSFPLMLPSLRCQALPK
uniref:Uncharacterized protein n=1 Tax=Geladintestivirus 4 TaxID=3233136 RepID=A0AAU8MJI1_9CAUD